MRKKHDTIVIFVFIVNPQHLFLDSWANAWTGSEEKIRYINFISQT
jgi:hypothetical protein